MNQPPTSSEHLLNMSLDMDFTRFHQTVPVDEEVRALSAPEAAALQLAACPAQRWINRPLLQGRTLGQQLLQHCLPAGTLLLHRQAAFSPFCTERGPVAVYQQGALLTELLVRQAGISPLAESAAEQQLRAAAVTGRGEAVAFRATAERMQDGLLPGSSSSLLSVPDSPTAGSSSTPGEGAYFGCRPVCCLTHAMKLRRPVSADFACQLLVD